MNKQDEAWANEEMPTARLHLIAAQGGAIQRALYDGLIWPRSASKIIDAVDRHIDEMTRKITERREGAGVDNDARPGKEDDP